MYHVCTEGRHIVAYPKCYLVVSLFSAVVVTVAQILPNEPTVVQKVVYNKRLLKTKDIKYTQLHVIAVELQSNDHPVGLKNVVSQDR